MTTAERRVLALISRDLPPPLDPFAVEALRSLIKRKLILLQRENGRPRGWAMTVAGTAAFKLAEAVS